MTFYMNFLSFLPSPIKNTLIKRNLHFPCIVDKKSKSLINLVDNLILDLPRKSKLAGSGGAGWLLMEFPFPEGPA
jgi:hypothetical protein